MSNNAPVWVRLYMESQNPHSSMPESIIGLLSQETQTNYVLVAALAYNDELYDYEVVERMNFINKTYVWRCEVLGDILPDEFMASEDQEQDGL